MRWYGPFRGSRRCCTLPIDLFPGEAWVACTDCLVDWPVTWLVDFTDLDYTNNNCDNCPGLSDTFAVTWMGSDDPAVWEYKDETFCAWYRLMVYVDVVCLAGTPPHWYIGASLHLQYFGGGIWHDDLNVRYSTVKDVLDEDGCFDIMQIVDGNHQITLALLSEDLPYLACVKVSIPDSIVITAQ